MGPARDPAQRAAPGPIPTDYAWDMLNPTDKSAVGATQADQIPMGRMGSVTLVGGPHRPVKAGGRPSRKAWKASGMSSVWVSSACPRFSSSSAAA